MKSIREIQIPSLSTYTAPILVPIIDWLPKYTRAYLLNDCIAGATVFAFLIPQGMAYALLAGMPPVYGLYTASIPIFIYVLLGTSKHISMGPFAITSLVLGTTARATSNFADGSPEYIQLCLNISMFSGIISFLMGFLKLGVLANFLGHSVLTGFITASSLLIGLSQLKYITGIAVPKFAYSHQTIIYLLSNLNQCNKWSLIIGLTAWISLYAVKYWKQKNKPTLENQKLKSYQILSLLATMSSLFAVVIGSIVAWQVSIAGNHVQIVGVVPAGLMPPGFSFVDVPTIFNILPSCCIISILSFAGNWAISKKFASMFDYEVNAGQELIAVGMTTVVGVLFNGFIVSGGLSRSAVNVEAGAKTLMSGVVSSILIIVSLLFFTKLFYYIPMAILGAVINVAVGSMIDYGEFVDAYNKDKNDFFIMITTFIVTFFIGIPEGVFSGVVLSIAVVMKTSAYPNIVHLGRLPDDQGGHFKNVERFKDALQIPKIAIVRMDATLFFANCEALKEVVLAASKGKFHSNKTQPIQLIVLDVSGWMDIDFAGIKALNDIHEALMKQKIQLCMAGAKFTVRDKLQSTHFIDKLGVACLHNTCEDAVRSLRERRMSVRWEMTSLGLIPPPALTLSGNTAGTNDESGDNDNSNNDNDNDNDENCTANRSLWQRLNYNSVVTMGEGTWDLGGLTPSGKNANEDIDIDSSLRVGLQNDDVAAGGIELGHSSSTVTPDFVEVDNPIRRPPSNDE